MSAPLPAGIDGARGGLGGHVPPKFLEHIVICASRGGITNKNSVISLKHFGPHQIFCPTQIFGLATVSIALNFFVPPLPY